MTTLPYRDPLPMPTSATVDAMLDDARRLLETEEGQAALGLVLRRFDEAVARVRAEEDARDLTALDGRSLASRAVLAQNAAQRLVPSAGSEPRFIFALLWWGVAEGRGFGPALEAVRRLHTRARLQAECERRADAHPVSASAGTIASAMNTGLGLDGPHVDEAVEELRKLIHLPQSVGHYTRPGVPRATPRGVPLVEPLGEIPPTLAKMARGEDVLGILGRALDGKLDHTPGVVVNRLKHAARDARRSERRGLGDDAPAPVFEVEVEVKVAAPADDDPLHRILRDEERKAARRKVERLRAVDPEVARTMELLADGMTQEEAARVLGIASRTVRQRRDRARRLLSRHK